MYLLIPTYNLWKPKGMYVGLFDWFFFVTIMDVDGGDDKIDIQC